MCGIVGIIHGDRDRTVDEHLLRSMTDVMQYRGPDDSGIWLGEGVGLGVAKRVDGIGEGEEVGAGRGVSDAEEG